MLLGAVQIAAPPFRFCSVEPFLVCTPFVLAAVCPYTASLPLFLLRYSCSCRVARTIPTMV